MAYKGEWDIEMGHIINHLRLSQQILIVIEKEKYNR